MSRSLNNVGLSNEILGITVTFWEPLVDHRYGEIVFERF
jgi:hypothetical protein